MIKPAQIQVRYADLDTMGHVNNTVYLSYFEFARVHYFNELLGLDWDWKKFGLLVVKNEISYLKPVHLNDLPSVELFIASIGSKSFTLAYEIRVNGQLTTTGQSVLVCFDAATNQSVAVSEEWRNALAHLKKTDS